MSAAFLQIAGSVLSGFAQIRQAQAQQVQYEMKARNEVIQARTDAVNYKVEGNERMRELLTAMSSSVANAAAGGLDPYGAMETKDLINLNSMKVAGMDIRKLNLNSEMAILRGESNAQQARLAGKAAVSYGTMAAMANVATQGADVMATSGTSFMPPKAINITS
tara:strand:- start:1388 stop:1879 length:492 start_codon:yes stop_codon:yes gene_type:complete